MSASGAAAPWAPLEAGARWGRSIACPPRWRRSLSGYPVPVGSLVLLGRLLPTFFPPLGVAPFPFVLLLVLLLLGPGGAAGHIMMAGGIQSYRVEVGSIPLPSDITGLADAWQREDDRRWTKNTRAHRIFWQLDSGTLGNAFGKQTRMFPDAVLPEDGDRSDSITVVLRPCEVGYMKAYQRMAAQMTGSDLAAPHSHYVVMDPPFLWRYFDFPPHDVLSYGRSQRTAGAALFVGLHQAKFPSCPFSLPATWYVRVPTWWAAVEVLFGAMVVLPLFQAYNTMALMDRDPLALNVFRSEWVILTGAYFLDCYGTRVIMWLYPKALHEWILRVGLCAIGQAPERSEKESAKVLGAMLALLDELPLGPALTGLLRRLDLERQDRVSWVAVAVSREDVGTKVLVNEDLARFSLPYLSDVMEARALADEADKWTSTPAPVCRLSGPSNDEDHETVSGRAKPPYVE